MLSPIAPFIALSADLVVLFIVVVSFTFSGLGGAPIPARVRFCRLGEGLGLAIIKPGSEPGKALYYSSVAFALALR